MRKRKFGYYALPLLWRDRVIGWGTLPLNNGTLRPEFGYVAGRLPRSRTLHLALEHELAAIGLFLGLKS